MKDFGTSVVTILTGVIGLALAAVLVSKNAQTGTVVNQFFTGFGNLITAATKPVSQ